MNTREAFARALRDVRKMKQLTQEDFSVVSSRTYLSALERGLKSPTLDKIGEICSVMHVHPLALMAITYGYLEDENPREVLQGRVLDQVDEIGGNES